MLFSAFEFTLTNRIIHLIWCDVVQSMQCIVLATQYITYNLKIHFFTPTIPLSCGCITLLHFSADLSIFSIFSRVERVAAFSAVAWRWSSTLLGGQQRQRHAWPWAHHPLPDKRRSLSSSLSFFILEGNLRKKNWAKKQLEEQLPLQERGGGRNACRII